jgi:hypothetical protein
MYNDIAFPKALPVNQELDKDEILCFFQKCLKQCKNWNTILIGNQTIIGNEINRITVETTKQGYPYLDDLIKASLKANLLLLMYNPLVKNQLICDCNYYENKVEHFFYILYIEFAKELWCNPYLMYHNYTPIEIKKNQKECILLIKECIKETIKKILPIKQILYNYLREDIIVNQEENNNSIQIIQEIKPEIENNLIDNIKNILQNQNSNTEINNIKPSVINYNNNFADDDSADDDSADDDSADDDSPSDNISLTSKDLSSLMINKVKPELKKENIINPDSKNESKPNQDSKKENKQDPELKKENKQDPELKKENKQDPELKKESKQDNPESKKENKQDNSESKKGSKQNENKIKYILKDLNNKTISEISDTSIESKYKEIFGNSK